MTVLGVFLLPHRGVSQCQIPNITHSDLPSLSQFSIPGIISYYHGPCDNEDAPPPVGL